MCEVSRNASFRYEVRWGRCIRRVVVCGIVSIAENVFKSPTTVVRWGLREEDYIRGMVVEHGDDIR